MYWRLDAGMAAAMGLSLVVGVAIVEALEQLNLEEELKGERPVLPDRNWQVFWSKCQGRQEARPILL